MIKGIEKAAEVTLNINVGDTLLFGRYKNSPKVVEDIGTDDKGQPTINGMKLLACRIEKLIPKKEKKAAESIRYRALRSHMRDKQGKRVKSIPILRIVADALNKGKQKRVGNAEIIKGFYGKNLFSALEVKPSYQGRGISKELLTRLFDKADQELGGKEIYTRAAPYNNKKLTRSQLMKIYRQYGFKSTGVPGKTVGILEDTGDGPAYAIGTGPGSMIRKSK